MTKEVAEALAQYRTDETVDKIMKVIEENTPGGYYVDRESIYPLVAEYAGQIAELVGSAISSVVHVELRALEEQIKNKLKR